MRWWPVAVACLLGGPALAQDPDPGVSRRELSRALSVYAHEPPVRRVVEAAVAAAGADPARARRLSRRGRRSGLLPGIRVGARRGRERDLSESISSGSDRTHQSMDDDLAFEAALTLRLDRLAYGPDEVALLREQRSLQLAREQITRAVVHLYFERRRLQLERDLRGRDTIEGALRIAEIEALLDAFTGGAFRRMMAPGVP